MVVSALGRSSCPIARSLAVLGDKCALLVVREALSGRTRFADFRSALGVAPDVLTDRLQRLVEAGVLEHRAYRAEGQRERLEYVLTDAGRELTPVLAALAGWGQHHRPQGETTSSRFVQSATGRPVRLGFVDENGDPVDPAEVSLARERIGTARL